MFTLTKWYEISLKSKKKKKKKENERRYILDLLNAPSVQILRPPTHSKSVIANI